MKQNKKKKIKGCACYGVNSIHPCFCSPFSNKDKPKQLKQADVSGSLLYDKLAVIIQTKDGKIFQVALDKEMSNALFYFKERLQIY